MTNIGKMCDSIDKLSVLSIRVLAADVVQKANSGHPGMPMGMAPVAHVLWSKILQISSVDSQWPNRDRFVLSNGHGCVLLYILLHLRGFKVTMDDLKMFRQWGSNTPGHPESFETDGVEVTTGPLGQGIGNAVGMAMAQRHLASQFNRPNFEIFSNYTFAFCGDGCLQEGVASEAASLAGHHKLGRLIVIYDDNSITIDGKTDLSFSENVPMRFEAYGWHTISVEDGDTDLKTLESAIQEAKLVTDRPTLICVKTTIGFLSSKAGTHGVHGAPLGQDDIVKLKESQGLDPSQSFVIGDSVRQFWHKVNEDGEAIRQDWLAMVNKYSHSFPREHTELLRRFSGKLPSNWSAALPAFTPCSPSNATRKMSGVVLNALADAVPELVGGSADLTPSNCTALQCTHDFTLHTPNGRYLRFGVREHGMVSIANGISAYGGLIPFTATFLNFITYAFAAVRLAALSHLRQILIMTHDSIGLGEDGPTHQPVEVLSLLRATPNCNLFRPADGNEVVAAYQSAIEHKGPTVIALTRQNVVPVPTSSVANALRGAYIVSGSANCEAIIIATGSEVGLAMSAAAALPFEVRVVSAPCLDIFKQQCVEYRREVLIPRIPVVSIEAQGSLGWSDYSHTSIAIPNWGASAPGSTIMKQLGFSTENVVKVVSEFVASSKANADVLPIGALACHY